MRVRTYCIAWNPICFAHIETQRIIRFNLILFIFLYFFCLFSQKCYLCIVIFKHLLNMQSHPTWVRGLKHLTDNATAKDMESHPTWVRGLKLLWFQTMNGVHKSHPTWVRGLKLLEKDYNEIESSRTLRGCVDWNINRICSCWITIKSHPTWVRGLKQLNISVLAIGF